MPTVQSRLPQNLTLHVGREESLLERLRSETASKELVLAPVELHRRNVQRRLREAQSSKEGVEFADPADIGKALVQNTGSPAKAIDRTDRLSMIRSVLTEGDPPIEGPAVPSDPQAIEQVRTEIENVTGFHPDRLGRIRDAASERSTPIDTDSAELVDAAVAVQRALRRRTEKRVSEVEVVRHAVRAVRETDGALWETTFPEISRVSLVGVSSVPAAHADLLYVIQGASSVPVHVHLRRGTGSYLTCRLPDLFDIDAPGTVVFEP
ncbi:hypothetical protein DVK02_13730 [Halobellus sp. Atlit-31R]|nr:hypothetical protein DVK02_13730 [Halobellus sp. Atlit-31R]